MALYTPGELLRPIDRPDPVPGPGEVRLRVRACGVCRTDLHVVDGDLTPRKQPIVPGHEIVGVIDAVGPGVTGLKEGDRIGVPWLGHSCGHCSYCLSDHENLCDAPGFTGWTIDGGFADVAIADARYCFPIPPQFDDVQAAPLLCAGLIGYRTWRMAGPPDTIKRVGIYGFGAAAHLLAQLAAAQGQTVFAFTRPGDTAAQALARTVGCAWAGGSDETPPEPLDAALLFAPVGALVPLALGHVRKGGIVVCGGIHMSDIPSFPYRLLWEERRLVSVANLTRRDALEYLPAAAAAGITAHVTRYRLADANQALSDLRDGRLVGAAVLIPEG